MTMHYVYRRTELFIYISDVYVFYLRLVLTLPIATLFISLRLDDTYVKYYRFLMAFII